jgi:hypothetical protein
MEDDILLVRHNNTPYSGASSTRRLASRCVPKHYWPKMESMLKRIPTAWLHLETCTDLHHSGSSSTSNEGRKADALMSASRGEEDDATIDARTRVASSLRGNQMAHGMKYSCIPVINAYECAPCLRVLFGRL